MSILEVNSVKKTYTTESSPGKGSIFRFDLSQKVY